MLEFRQQFSRIIPSIGLKADPRTDFWIESKMKRGWKKMTLPEARDMMKKKYETIKLLFNSIKEYI